MYPITRTILSTLAAAILFAALGATAQADVLGQHHPGMTRPQQPQVPTNPNPPAGMSPQIKHKKVVSVTTFVVNQAGVQRTVTWDFTSHLWNAQSRTWVELPWGRSYISAILNLNAQGWRAHNAQSNGTRIVTGTW